MLPVSKRGLSSATIKLIAVAAMLVDHIAWCWLPQSAVPGFIMHTLGRITAPVMCFFIAEGYYRTRNVGRYALRLFVFALISQIPYCYFMTGRVAFAAALPGFSGMYNMMFTLFFGLLALCIIQNRRLPRALRILLASLCCAVTYFCDWSFFGVLFILAFGARPGDKRSQAALFLLLYALLVAAAITGGGWSDAYYSGVLLALPFILLYNGERGGPVRGAAVKYAFYVFYPLHMLLLALIRHHGLL